MFVCQYTTDVCASTLLTFCHLNRRCFLGRNVPNKQFILNLLECSEAVRTALDLFQFVDAVILALFRFVLSS